MVGACQSWSSALCNPSTSSSSAGARDLLRPLPSRCQLTPSGPRLTPQGDRAGIRAHGTLPSSRTYEVDVPVHALAGVSAVSPSGSPSASVDDSKNGNGSTGLSKADYAKFVHFFRQAGPYIEGHRDKTFVIVIPGSVSCLWRAVCATADVCLPQEHSLTHVLSLHCRSRQSGASSKAL